MTFSHLPLEATLKRSSVNTALKRSSNFVLNFSFLNFLNIYRNKHDKFTMILQTNRNKRHDITYRSMVHIIESGIISFRHFKNGVEIDDIY